MLSILEGHTLTNYDETSQTFESDALAKS